MDLFRFLNWLNLPILVFLIGTILVLLSNLLFFKGINKFPFPKKWPRVSILIPARNEELHIEACVRSLLEQDYPDYEVLVLDDESTDKTLDILLSISREYPKLRVIHGRPLPSGWVGKNWACHQLSKAATGVYLLFTDADTIHHSKTIKESISAIIDQKADLLTLVPYERMGTIGEKLLLPHIFFSFLIFIPVGLAHRIHQSSLCFAIGQFMLFRRSSYLQIGGHKVIKNVAMEDLALGRRIKRAGLRWRVYDGGQRVQCRMYNGFTETWKGLTKFLFLGYEGQIPVLILGWLFTSYIYIVPLVFLVMALTGDPNYFFPLSFDVIAIGLSLALWIVAFWRLRFPALLGLAYPFIFLLNLIMTINSMILTLSGQTTWKGRTILKQET